MFDTNAPWHSSSRFLLDGVASIFGGLCAAVRASGRSPRPRRFDPLIASVRVEDRLPLLTRNSQDFTDLHSKLEVIAVVPPGR